MGGCWYWGDGKCFYTKLEYRRLKAYRKIRAENTSPWKIIFSGFKHAYARHLRVWRILLRITECTTSWKNDGALPPIARRSLWVCWPVLQMCACCRFASIEANLVEDHKTAVDYPSGLYAQHGHRWIWYSACRTGIAFLRILSSDKYIWLCAVSYQCHLVSWEAQGNRLAHRHFPHHSLCPQLVLCHEGSSLWRA